jgi:hypothetical protein
VPSLHIAPVTRTRRPAASRRNTLAATQRRRSIRRPIFALTLASGALAGAAAPAHAVPCGQIDPATKKPAKATLTLDDKTSRTSIVFGRETHAANLSLVFVVSGCELEGELSPGPQVFLLPKQGADELPPTAVKFERAVADGSALYLKATVEPRAFEPDSYEGFAVARGPYMATTRTPFAVSRSEHRWLIPIGIGALAGFAGLLWWFATRWAVGEKFKGLSRGRIALLVLLPVTAGAVAVMASYLDQTVWSFDDNVWGALVAGFTGATTGSMAAVLLAIREKPTSAAG